MCQATKWEHRQQIKTTFKRIRQQSTPVEAYYRNKAVAFHPGAVDFDEISY